MLPLEQIMEGDLALLDRILIGKTGHENDYRKEYAQGSSIESPGKPFIGLVLTGSVMEVLEREGEKPIVLDIMFPWEHVGIPMPVDNDSLDSIKYVAREQSSILILPDKVKEMIPSEISLENLEEWADEIKDCLKKYSQERRNWITGRLKELINGKNAPERMYYALNLLAVKLRETDGQHVAIPITHAELGQMSNVAREYVTTYLNRALRHAKGYRSGELADNPKGMALLAKGLRRKESGVIYFRSSS